MRTFNYSTIHFPLHKFVEGYLYNEIAFTQAEWDFRVFNILNDASFIKTYDKFVKYSEPFFEHSGLTSARQPIFRIHDHERISQLIGDISKISHKSKIIYVPLAPLFGTNSFLIESRKGLRDFNFVELKVGQFMVEDCDKESIEVKNKTGIVNITMAIGFNPSVS